MKRAAILGGGTSLALAALLFVGACDSGNPDGAAIYRVRCAFCHGDGGRGDGPAGRRLQPQPANFTAPAFWTVHTAEQVGQTILRGVPGTSMPGYEGTLTSAQLTSLVQYLETFRSHGPGEDR